MGVELTPCDKILKLPVILFKFVAYGAEYAVLVRCKFESAPTPLVDQYVQLSGNKGAPSQKGSKILLACQAVKSPLIVKEL